MKLVVRNTLPIAIYMPVAMTLASIGARAQTAASNGPVMSLPLTLNPKPYSINTDALGVWYFGGVASAQGMLQTDPHGGQDTAASLDASNLMAFIQKTDGLLQFYSQIGEYDNTTVGAPYIRSSTWTSESFGLIPVIYGILAPTDGVTVNAGKLPTMMGSELNNSFQNENIEHSVSCNIEPIISRGAQINYATGPYAIAIRWSDGFYSDQFNWLTVSLSWKIDTDDQVFLIAGGNLGHSSLDDNQAVTPASFNESQIYNLMYTYTRGAINITPLIQVTHIPAMAGVGAGDSYGLEVLADYGFNDHWNLSARGEYIISDQAANTTGFGSGSSVWSVTVTPTYMWGRYFVRPETSYIDVTHERSGLGFGAQGDKTTQIRGLIEAGVIF